MCNIGRTSCISVRHIVIVLVKLRGLLTRHSQVQVHDHPGTTTLVQTKKTQSDVSSATKWDILKENVRRQGNQVEGRPWTNQVQFRQQQPPQSTPMEQDPQAFLESSSDEEVVHQVRMKDTGS